APLLGVLPGTGGLTRLVDKRKIRRDLADVFSTVAEGVRGKRAVEWGLVDEAPSKAKFDEALKRRAEAMTAGSKRQGHKPGAWTPLGDKKYVSLEIVKDARTATLTVRAPEGKEPETPDELAKAGANAWAIRAFRELDDALLDLRFNHPLVGVVAVKTSGPHEG